MGRKLRHIAIGIIIGAIILVILLLILPIKVLYDIPVESLTVPNKEWKLIQDGEQFRTELTNYTPTDIPMTRNFIFERGDVVDIEFAEHALEKELVEKDALLLRFNSMMQTMRIQQALNEIEIEKSLQYAGRAAMKAPLIDEAKAAIELARANTRLQQANFDRMSQLLKDEVISRAELDMQTNLLEVSKQELVMAENRLRNTSFEQKSEDLAVYSTRIESLDREINVLLAQQNSYNVTSPFSGRITLNPDSGVIMSVQESGRQALLFPFPISGRDLLDKSSFLEVTTKHGELILPFSLKNKVAVVRGQQQCLGIATVENEPFSIGEIVSARVVCDTVLLREYIFRKLL